MPRIMLAFGLLVFCQLMGAYAQGPIIYLFAGSGCQRISNSTPASLDKRNRFLADIFANITYADPSDRFYNVTVGDIPNKVYILFQCRGDLTLSNCRDCISIAGPKILQECPLHNEATVWYEECMLRYAYRNIFSLKEIYPYQYITIAPDVSNYDVFAPVLTKTMNGLIKAATMGSNGTHFAAAEMKVTSSQTVYSFAQCTSDLSNLQCQSCLQTILTYITGCCKASTGAMVFLPSCQLKYDDQPIHIGDFLADPSLAPAPSQLLFADQGYEAKNTGQSSSATPTINKKGPLQPAIKFAIAFATSFGLALIIAGLWLFLRRKKVKNSSQRGPEATYVLGNGDMDDIRNLESLQFDFKDVEAATSNFSGEYKLGQGGFGEVYKGKFSNGQDIAVKRLSKNSQQGDIEFKNEVVLLAKLQHRNLVKLLGFCTSGEEKILIYEFLSNSSLDRFLKDTLNRASLEWTVRYKIITGIARGLLYLHEDSRLKIIHRDLKVSNILLDEAMTAKIADFGLAKLFDFDQTQGDTMKIAGTYGYMAPEYALAGQFSVKSDVYSFGVIILEVISGQRNRFYQQEEDEGLLYRAWRLWNEGVILELVDPLIGDKFSEDEVKLCIQIGLLCIQEEATHRPRMASVVAALNGQSITLPLPNAPHFFNVVGDVDNATSNFFMSKPGNEIEQRSSNNCNGVHTGPVSITDLCSR